MTNGSNGRSSNGRFTKGNLGGPGNPYTRQVAQLRAVLLSTITEQDVQAVARIIIEKAKEGDMAAVKLFLAYAVGAAQPYQDPDETSKSHEQVKAMGF